MIAQQHRFHGYNSLQYVMKRGQTIAHPSFKIKHVKGKLPDFRLSVVVSKKVDKRAVVRNRIRRRIYELFRLAFQSTTLSVDVVVIVFNKDLAFISNGELQKIFSNPFQQLNTKYKTEKLC